MSATRQSPQDLHNLFREVWRVERQIRSERSPFHRVGHDGWPGQELVRFRSSQHLGFAGKDMADIKHQRTNNGLLKADIAVNSIGLTGARGALPVHYTELVLSQLKSRSPVLRDFLDLFNHRLISLFYRSWEKTRPAVHQERNDEDIFTHILKALTNTESNWQLYYGAALNRGVQSAATVRAVLSDLTGMPVTLRGLQGHWSTLDPADQSRLPSASNPKGQYATLGEATLGSRIWMADGGADIVFYPKDQAQLQALLPGGRFSQTVSALTRRLISGPMHVKYRVETRIDSLTGTVLGRQGRLGADSFISVRRPSDRTVNVCFKPGKG